MRAMLAVAMALVWPCAAENAVFDRHGRVSAMIYGGDELSVRTNLGAALKGWTRVAGLEQSERIGLVRGQVPTTWTGRFEVQKGQSAQFRQTVTEKAGQTEIAITLTAEADLDVEGVFYWIDVPRAGFVGGGAELGKGASARLPSSKPPGRDFLSGEAAEVTFLDAANNLRLTATLDRPRAVFLEDKWERSGRAYSARIEMQRGPLAKGATVSLNVALSVEGKPDASPARLVLDAGRTRYKLDGFGGNYCFEIESPVTQYTLKNLRVAWARTEMTLEEWEPENDNDSPTDTNWEYFKGRDKPGSNLHREFLLAKQIQDLGIPYVISIWHLPEWLYADPNSGRRGRARQAPAEKWEEVLESIGSYLVYAKQQYGVEPDLFSFNEANIGVYVLLSAEEHREAIKSIGARFERLGLRTKMLLADATGPRGTHEYALAAANDPEAMRYVGAVGFHSWGGGTPEQYAAWGDLAEWLRLPLLVTELGVDAAAWRGRIFDSFHYGLREVRMYQELLLHARPQGAMQWEFTADYSTVKTGTNPLDLVPTHRFWFVKHFTDLTPRNADALATSSDHSKVLFTAFAAEREGRRVYTLHVANLGAAREVTIQGLPEDGRLLRAVRTSESEQFRELPPVKAEGGAIRLQMPARALVTLTSLGGR